MTTDDVTEQEITRLERELTQVHQELKDLQQRLEEAMNGRSYWFKKCLSLEAKLDHFTDSETATKLAQAHADLADACTMRDALTDEANELEESRDYNVRLVEERDRTIAHVCRELKDLQGANRALGQQLADVTDNREFWFKQVQALEMDLYHAAEEQAVIIKAAEALSADRQALAQLVTPELAALLERLARYANLCNAPGSAYDARALAVRIKEALDDSQA